MPNILDRFNILKIGVVIVKKIEKLTKKKMKQNNQNKSWSFNNFNQNNLPDRQCFFCSLKRDNTKLQKNSNFLLYAAFCPRILVNAILSRPRF